MDCSRISSSKAKSRESQQQPSQQYNNAGGRRFHYKSKRTERTSSYSPQNASKLSLQTKPQNSWKFSADSIEARIIATADEITKKVQLEKVPPSSAYNAFKVLIKNYKKTPQFNARFLYLVILNINSVYERCLSVERLFELADSDTEQLFSDDFFVQHARLSYEAAVLEAIEPSIMASLTKYTGRDDSFAGRYSRYLTALCAEYSPHLLENEEIGAEIRFSMTSFSTYLSTLTPDTILPKESKYYRLLSNFILATELQFKHCNKMKIRGDVSALNPQKDYSRFILPKLEKYKRTEKPLIVLGWALEEVVGHLMLGILFSNEKMRVVDVRCTDQDVWKQEGDRKFTHIPVASDYRIKQNFEDEDNFRDILSFSIILQHPRVCQVLAESQLPDDKIRKINSLIEEKQSSIKKTQDSLKKLVISLKQNERQNLPESKEEVNKLINGLKQEKALEEKLIKQREDEYRSALLQGAEQVFLSSFSREKKISPHEQKNPLDTYRFETKNQCAVCFRPLLYELMQHFLAKEENAAFNNHEDMAVIKIFLDAIILNYKKNKFNYAAKVVASEKHKLYLKLPILEKKLPSLQTALKKEWENIIHAAIPASKIGESEQKYLLAKLGDSMTAAGQA